MQSTSPVTFKKSQRYRSDYMSLDPTLLFKAANNDLRSLSSLQSDSALLAKLRVTKQNEVFVDIKVASESTESANESGITQSGITQSVNRKLATREFYDVENARAAINFINTKKLN